MAMQPRIAPGVVRVSPRQPWIDDPAYRVGPKTPDGFWFVSRQSSMAIRAVIDDDAPVRGQMSMIYALRDAERGSQVASEDEYLESLSFAMTMDAPQLARLRDMVSTGAAGGPTDGAS